MEAKARSIQLPRYSCGIDGGQQDSYPPDLIGANATRVIVLEQSLQSLVAKSFDHLPNVKRKFTLYNG